MTKRWSEKTLSEHSLHIAKFPVEGVIYAHGHGTNQTRSYIDEGYFNQCPLPKVGRNDLEDNVRTGGSRDARPRAHGAHVKEKEEG